MLNVRDVERLVCGTLGCCMWNTQNKGIGKAWDVGCLSCWLLEMQDVGDVRIQGLGKLWIREVGDVSTQDVVYLGGGMIVMWGVWGVGCLSCGMFQILDVWNARCLLDVDLQNTNVHVEYIFEQICIGVLLKGVGISMC